MKKFFLKWGHVFAAFAIVCASLGTNVTCAHCYYQPKVPDAARRLKKF